MNSLKLVPLASIAIMFFLIFVENKYGEGHSSAGTTLRDGAASWKKIVIGWNDHIRYGGIFIFFLGSSFFSMQVRRQPGEESFLLLAVAGVGVLIFFIALGLRIYVARSD
jgi:hypothetical protein